MSDLTPSEPEPSAPGSPPPPPPPTSTPLAVDDRPEPSSGKAWKTWVVAGVVAAVVAVGAAVVLGRSGSSSASQSVAAGAPNGNAATQGGYGLPGGGRFGGRGTQGTIESLTGDTLTVKATGQDGTTSRVTVETSDTTTYHETVAGTLSDLAVGDQVVVTGATSGSVLTAATIVDRGTETTGFPGFPGGGTPPQGGVPGGYGGTAPASGDPAGSGRGGYPGSFGPGRGRGGQGGPGGFTAGEIVTVGDEGTITLKAQDGSTMEVATGTATQVSVTKAIGLGDLAVGDAVRVTGTTSGTTITATAIQKGELAGFGFGGRPGGANGPTSSAPTTTS